MWRSQHIEHKMKAATTFVLLLTICTIDCRKVVPINKNANIDFINMESGGGARPISAPVPGPAPAKPQSFDSPKTPTGPAPQPKLPVPSVTTPVKPVPVVVPTVPPPTQIKPIVPKPVQPLPNQMDLKPVPAKPSATGGVTTPGYGNVKQLVTFYDSQGKASVIRPYSYSSAVKQG